MIPLRDSLPTRRKPYVLWLIISVNIFVFLLELLAADMEVFVQRWGLVAAEVNFLSFDSPSINSGSLRMNFEPFITSQFLHGGLFHLFSNMWFLKIFGDNVEDELGHLKFLFFYLLAGVVAGLSQYIFMTQSKVPMIGASGAVAGVLGAYFVFFPHHRIETLIPVWGFVRIMELPAAFILFYWFMTQLFAGFGSLIYTSVEVGGVAFLAHAGGFGFGWTIAKLKIKNKK